MVYASSDEKTMRVYDVADKPHYMDISNFTTSYYNPCRKDIWNVVCVVYDTTSDKCSLWVNHGKIRDFACRLLLRASTLNFLTVLFILMNLVALMGILKVLRCPTGLISFKIPKRADGTI